MKYLPKISFILYLLCIPMCVGEAIPDNEDRLYFSINNYSEVFATETPPEDKPYMAPPKVTPPVIPPVTLPVTPPADKLGLVPISGFSVDQVTEGLLQKAIVEYVKARAWYDDFSKTLGNAYTFATDGYIYNGNERRGVHFYDANKFGKELANTYGVPIGGVTIGGVKQGDFACTETPFQAAKVNLVKPSALQTFINNWRKKATGQIQGDAKTVTTGVPASSFKSWDDSSVWVMINLVLGKALQNPNDPMIKMLIHQIDRKMLIVEHTKNDARWGDGSKVQVGTDAQGNPIYSQSNTIGTGENRLGLIWMAVRNTLKEHYGIPE